MNNKTMTSFYKANESVYKSNGAKQESVLAKRLKERDKERTRDSYVNKIKETL